MVNVIVIEVLKLLRLATMGLIVFLLLITPPNIKKSQDPEVKPYVNEFIRLGRLFRIKHIKEKVNGIIIKFGQVKDKEYANCNYFYNEITINKKAWAKLSHENKEELIFHELGHCVLNIQKHREVGIMKAVGLHHPLEYRFNYEFLINDLFSRKSNPKLVKWNKNKYTSSKEIPLTKEEVLNNEHAVIRFTATWCPPCKALAPVFTEVAEENPSVKTYVVDVDENPDLASQMGIKGIPCVIKIKNKAVDTVLVGNQPKPELEKLFK